MRVAALIADAVERVSNSLGSHRIEVSLEDEDLVAPLHKGLIEQVLVNLIDNAIVHTYPDAVISINAGRKLGCSSCPSPTMEEALLLTRSALFSAVFDRGMRFP